MEAERKATAARRECDKSVGGAGKCWQDAGDHRPGRCTADLLQGRAMPDLGESYRMGGVPDGGSRGCCQRVKVSITIMRPQQQGHGGRGRQRALYLTSSV